MHVVVYGQVTRQTLFALADVDLSYVEIWPSNLNLYCHHGFGCCFSWFPRRCRISFVPVAAASYQEQVWIFQFTKVSIRDVSLTAIQQR